MGLPLAGTHRPGRAGRFYGNSRRIRYIFRADRVVGPYSGIFDPPCSVGADDSVRPLDAVLFTRIYGEFVTFPRADVGIGPYNYAGNCIRMRRRFL